jgi:hypothetical protein
MKRTLIISAVALFALPAFAHAQVARSTHFGHLVGAPDSAVKFKQALGGSSSVVTSFAVRNFTVSCDGGATGLLKVAKLKGAVTVGNRGNFHVANDNGRTVFRVRGHIGRNKATGTFRYSGLIEGTDGVTHNCDSGPLGWVTRP